MTRADERGAATVIAVALIGVLVSFGFGCAGAGSVVVAHRRAQAAADLAALAAAGARERGEDSCAAARGIARRNGTRLSSCSVQGDDVVVGVHAVTVPLLGQRYVLAARARAGPAGGSPVLVPRGVP